MAARDAFTLRAPLPQAVSFDKRARRADRTQDLQWIKGDPAMVGVMHRFAWLAVAALAFTPATPALAHAHLLSSVPAAGSTAMPPPTALRLNFSEGLELKFTKVKLIGPEKNAIGTGSAALDPKDDKVVILPVSSGLADGKYTVEWQAVSTDGHKTTGSYSFSTMK